MHMTSASFCCASSIFYSLLVDSVAVEEQERERRRQVVEKFQKAPFEEIAAHCGARVSDGFCVLPDCLPNPHFPHHLSVLSPLPRFR